MKKIIIALSLISISMLSVACATKSETSQEDAVAMQIHPAHQDLKGEISPAK